MEKIRLHVNGKINEISTYADTPLLYVLRNQLALNGPRFGCGMHQCGACMVLINDQPRFSCMTPAKDLQEEKIITLEGLTSNGKLNAIQQAFIDEQAAQCGYCINGMIIAATGLLKTNPHPTDDDIKAAMQPVLCRCGTQSRVIRAIKLAAKK